MKIDEKDNNDDNSKPKDIKSNDENDKKENETKVKRSKKKEEKVLVYFLQKKSQIFVEKQKMINLQNLLRYSQINKIKLKMIW